MALTPFQLKYLRFDLIGLGDIKYDDVVDELLDHYASLTEQKMETGLAFEEASKQAWADLGAEKGVQKIQASFVKSIEQQIKTQHLTILKSYSRWPMLVTTALVGLLVYMVVPLIPVKWLIWVTLLIGTTPYLFILLGCYYGLHKQTDTGKLVWQYLLSKCGLAICIINLSLNLFNRFFNNAPQETRTLLETYPTISVLICLLLLLYTASFIQLFQHQYKQKFV
ncbi:hypothetical protein [Spirosoma linguale]|uniref:Uncharacterized protein n=1 Tax=Spirosoma linguale (strain ATCC 33905 / DSM 74 / LMG 10896 / Claus 1) TaxID=504472 RepID=D2QUI6_SPILD|nr:hypothetical protein Slin_6511 [Spirosoma linguale DSM 74]